MSSPPFKIKPVLDEMIELYRQRTLHPQIQYIEAEYRVGWTDISASMKRHGYVDDVVAARLMWDEQAAVKFNRACRKILAENGEDPKKIRRRQNWKSDKGLPSL